MTNMRSYQTGLTSLLVHIFSIPLFSLFFLQLYRSQWMVEWLYMIDGRWYVLNVLVVCLIELGVLCCSRIPMTACKIRMPWFYYALWTIAEVVVTAFFFGLYMVLMYRGLHTYFYCVGRSMLLFMAVEAYPYAIVNLIIALKKEDGNRAEDSLVRFFDFTERLKLVIASDAILFIEAEENYCHIHYLEGERHREYSLRNSMTRIQPIMEKQGIVRCQRSYFVNPRHVKVLRRDKEGVILAELDVNGLKAIPVSPKYYNDLNEKLV